MSLNLNDLSNKNTTGDLQPVSISDIGAKKSPDPDAIEPTNMIASAFGALDEKIDELKQQREAEQAKVAAEAENAEVDLDNYDPDEDDTPISELSGETDHPVPDSDNYARVNTMENKADTAPNVEATETPIQKEMREEREEKAAAAGVEAKSNDTSIDDIFSDDISDENQEFLKELADTSNEPDIDGAEELKDTAEALSDEETKKILNNYSNDMKALLAKKNKRADTSGFTVSSKHITMSKLLSIKEPDKNKADWVMPTAKKAFSMYEMSGLDIQKINPRNSNRNRINTVKEIYKTIYKHIVGATKDGFESWIRSVPYRDVNQYYFAACRATFGEFNVLTYQCGDPKCSNIFIKEVPIDNMWEITDEKAKEEFNKIYEGDTTLEVDFGETITPVSDKFAVGLIEPTIYSAEIEPLMMDEEMRTKYARIIGFLPFIKNIYYIDRENKTYIPIDEQADPNSVGRTAKNKLAIYYNILGSLPNDSFAELQAYVYNYQQRPEVVTFFNPECTCPKCGKAIAREDISAPTMLFNRAQSGLMANLSER